MVSNVPGYNVVGVGDINGDHYADIVVQNPITGQIDYVNMANGIFSGFGAITTLPGWTVDAVSPTSTALAMPMLSSRAAAG